MFLYEIRLSVTDFIETKEQISKSIIRKKDNMVFLFFLTIKLPDEIIRQVIKLGIFTPKINDVIIAINYIFIISYSLFFNSFETKYINMDK